MLEAELSTPTLVYSFCCLTTPGEGASAVKVCAQFRRTGACSYSPGEFGIRPPLRVPLEGSRAVRIVAR